MSKDDDTIAKLEAQCESYREALSKVPHSRGDHTDLCRMNNDGQVPKDAESCCCHVGKVTAALKREEKG
jgi:hypothetical protein